MYVRNALHVKLIKVVKLIFVFLEIDGLSCVVIKRCSDQKRLCCCFILLAFLLPALIQHKGLKVLCFGF